MIVEVEANENCEASLFARFKEAGPPRQVDQVRLYDRNPSGEWYWVTGWTDDAEAPVSPPTHNWSKIQAQGWRILSMGGSMVSVSSLLLSMSRGASIVRTNGERRICRWQQIVICAMPPETAGGYPSPSAWP